MKITVRGRTIETNHFPGSNEPGGAMHYAAREAGDTHPWAWVFSRTAAGAVRSYWAKYGNGSDDPELAKALADL